MNNILEQAINQKLENAWTDIVGANIPCSLVHPNQSCTTAAIIKFLTVFKIGCKYYFPLYFIQLLVKLRNTKKLKQKQIIEILKKAGRGYIGSLLFMSFLVTGLRVGYCMFGVGNLQVLSITFPTSTSIFFEEPSRKEQLTYFVMARMFKSLFVAFDRRYMRYFPSFIPKIMKNQDFMFILMTALLIYCSLEVPLMLKNSKTMSQMWGTCKEKPQNQKFEKNSKHQEGQKCENESQKKKIVL